jgi:mono/diheme cytochrome c family protein
MSRLVWFLSGAISLAAIGVAAGFVVLTQAHGLSAREQPMPVERWVARRARAAALPADAKDRVNPVPNTFDVLVEARAHWADHCAQCHANDGSGDVEMGKRLYPPAPDMRLAETQEMTDGELFYIIQNGVRLTGMPAWGGGSGHDEEASWKLVHFIRHLPQMSFQEKKEMEKLNPRTPDELREEEEEQKFLNGEDTHEQPTEHQHHH